MSVNNVERNEKNISENIVKLTFERNIKTLLENHLVYNMCRGNRFLTI